MDEIENKEQKSKLCRLAILSPLLVLFAFLFMLTITFLPETEFVARIIILTSFCSFIASFVIGILAIHKIQKSQGELKGRFIALLGIILALLLILAMLMPTCNKYKLK
jgi:hypothetical protein